MMPSERIVAKAAEMELRSDAIVVSFQSEWYESLLKKRFRSVIRRRVPTSFKPQWLYFHINAPKGAICARARIMAIVELECSKALEMTRELDLSAEAIQRYVRGLRSVGCYQLGPVYLARREVTTVQLASRLVYHPPQSFFVLSKEAKELLDRLCGFRIDRSKTEKTHRK